MRMILPAAGFGTRVGMNPDQSKELLLNNGIPLIHFSLDIAKYCKYDPLVITRKEKVDLINYCKEEGVETLLIEPEGEWAHTVLKSRFYWQKHNILILPDTVFNYEIPTVQTIEKNLKDGFNACFGMHEVENSSKWGIIDKNTLTEKPEKFSSGMAWGIIGFSYNYGTCLFDACKDRLPLSLQDCNGIILDDFKDLTREKNNLTF